MAVHLSTPISTLPGIGPIAAADFKLLGISSVRDLLDHVPYRYDDYSKKPPLSQVRDGDAVTVTAKVREISTRPSKNNPRLKITQAILEDESGTLKAIWFNQPFLEKTLRPGSVASFAGKADGKFFGLALANPVVEPAGADVQTGRILPVYGLAGSLTHRRVRSSVAASAPAFAELGEWLPADLVASEGLVSETDAYRFVHTPVSNGELVQGVERLKFDELFLHQLMFAAVRAQRQTRPAHPLPVDEAFLKSFAASLPFELTNAQRRAAWDVIQDCAKPVPMNRLLEGDVGSGKTAVAAVAAASIVHGGGTVAYLAPTELLAGQQQEALQKFLPDAAIGLLTGSRARIGNLVVPRGELLKAVAVGDVPVLVGTHALLQDGVSISNLSLVVVDEQHRFGVQQRHALLGTSGVAPHLLSMTATPIPRSLALTLYGDLDVSVLNQRPKGRKPIITKALAEKNAKDVWAALRQEFDAGRQAYIVCPLIDPSDTLGSTSVTELAADLKKGALKGCVVEVLHGKMKAEEKQKALSAFKEGKVQALVSTTVVEVGVDVPNATAMVIVGAERFGLAQLHQLRGRVGRGEHASACYLIAQEGTRASMERLNALVECSDGFLLAEKDMQLRGAGNVFGDAQSGFPDFKLATMADVDLMRRARDAAQRVLALDPKLASHPLLAKRVEGSFDQVHLE